MRRGAQRRTRLGQPLSALQRLGVPAQHIFREWCSYDTIGAARAGGWAAAGRASVANVRTSLVQRPAGDLLLKSPVPAVWSGTCQVPVGRLGAGSSCSLDELLLLLQRQHAIQATSSTLLRHLAFNATEIAAV